VKLIVISPESEDGREPAVIARLFAAGLTHYHVRKPSWDRGALAAYLHAIPTEYHPRIVLHSHHDLVDEVAIGGLHFRDTDGPPSPLFRSRAVHDLATLRASLDRYDRLLFSPVFPSLSKPGRLPDPLIATCDLRALFAQPRRAEVIALGGIDASRVAQCCDLGFDGVAVLGAIWQSADPVRAFHDLQQALLAHAA
jgi:thiamine-phosphate pyrophosphorylase